MFQKNASSLYKGAFDGQGQALSLRYVVVCFVSFVTAFGCLSLTTQLLLFRKNHARLVCSVVNAITTARCRYQLLRIADSRNGCPYGTILFFTPCEAPASFHFSLFTFHFSLFSAVRLATALHQIKRLPDKRKPFQFHKTMQLTLNAIISIIILI